MQINLIKRYLIYIDLFPRCTKIRINFLELLDDMIKNDSQKVVEESGFYDFLKKFKRVENNICLKSFIQKIAQILCECKTFTIKT